MAKTKRKRSDNHGTRPSGPATPIGPTPVAREDWRSRVEARLAALAWSRADLAREARVGKPMISDLLNGKRNECIYLDRIHRALGWDVLPAILPLLEEELLSAFRILQPTDQGRVLEFARAPARKP